MDCSFSFPKKKTEPKEIARVTRTDINSLCLVSLSNDHFLLRKSGLTPSICIPENILGNVDDRAEVIVQEWKDTDHARGAGVQVPGEIYKFPSNEAVPTSGEKQ